MSASPIVIFNDTTSTVTFIGNNMPSGVWLLGRRLTRWQRWRLRAAMATGRLERWLTPL